MKTKISKSLILPMLYGILAAWIVGGGVGVALLYKYAHLSVLTMILATSAVLLWAVIPVLVRAAWVYSNLRRFHTAEYFYNLGNGLEIRKALAMYESRVNKAVYLWINRNILRPAFNVMGISYFLVVVQTGNWLSSLWVLAAFVLVLIAIEIGVWTMLLVARKMSYDKYGNLKNN